MGIFRPVVDWFTGTILKWFLRVLGLWIGVTLDMVQWVLNAILSLLLTIVETVIGFFADSGLIPTVDFSALPADAMLFLGYLRLPEAFAIIIGAMAIRFVRMAVLRF